MTIAVDLGRSATKQTNTDAEVCEKNHYDLTDLSSLSKEKRK